MHTYFNFGCIYLVTLVYFAYHYLKKLTTQQKFTTLLRVKGAKQTEIKKQINTIELEIWRIKVKSYVVMVIYWLIHWSMLFADKSYNHLSHTIYEFGIFAILMSGVYWLKGAGTIYMGGNDPTP